MTQVEKKADFLHHAADTYIQDARAANRPELAHLWNAIKQDEQRHLDLLKQELAKDVQKGRLRKHTHIPNLLF
jgi:rubrerythrin